MKKVITSEFANLTFDKVSQALINQLPFFTGLLFVTQNYQEYYQIITIIFLGISFGNLGLDRAFANSELNVILMMKRIFVFRIIISFIVFLFCLKYLNVSVVVSLFSSLIVFTNTTTLGEFLYVGQHLEHPLITIKLIIVIAGLFLRYLYNDTLSLIVLLAIESLIFSVSLSILLQKKLKFKKELKNLQVIDYRDVMYSLLLLSLSFLVTKIYIYYDLDLTIRELKYLHLSDYIVVVASFVGSVIIRLALIDKTESLLKSFLITASMLVIVALFVHDVIGYYLVAKIISAINVLYIYLLYSRSEIRHSFLINIGSLVIMVSFLLFASKSGIFVWMAFAELSVITSAYIYSKLRLE